MKRTYTLAPPNIELTIEDDTYGFLMRRWADNPPRETTAMFIPRQVFRHIVCDYLRDVIDERFPEEEP